MAQKRKLTDEQIVGVVVKQPEPGPTVAEMAPEIGVSTYTIYSWKRGSAGRGRTRQRSSVTWKKDESVAGFRSLDRSHRYHVSGV